MDSIDLRKYHRRVLSQFGQDGVLEKIFDTIGMTQKFFVEFGSHGNDEGMGNTPYLRTKGWDGLLISAEEHTGTKYPVKRALIDAENIEGLFKEQSVPSVFGFLSIDIDGNNFYVWQAINSYRPTVVAIECNPHFTYEVDTVFPYNPKHVWDGSTEYGASLKAMQLLGASKDYELVAYCAIDAIFVDKRQIPSSVRFVDNAVETLSAFDPYLPENRMGVAPEGWLTGKSLL